MTSSGARVNKRNLDGEESSFRDDLRGKSRFGKRLSMKNSSRSKVSRQRRAAICNALSFLSRISGKASDGGEDVLEGNSYQSHSSEQETEAGSEETEISSKNEENGHLKEDPEERNGGSNIQGLAIDLKKSGAVDTYRCMSNLGRTIASRAGSIGVASGMSKMSDSSNDMIKDPGKGGNINKAKEKTGKKLI
nr:PH-interacting protein [Tanacetum cinerariifolium]